MKHKEQIDKLYLDIYLRYWNEDIPYIVFLEQMEQQGANKHELSEILDLGLNLGYSMDETFSVVKLGIQKVVDRAINKRLEQ